MRNTEEGKRGADESQGPSHDAEGDADKRDADSAFDDLIIEVDEAELQAELNDQPPARKV
jgi:hypothetical protein